MISTSGMPLQRAGAPKFGKTANFRPGVIRDYIPAVSAFQLKATMIFWAAFVK
jgi:hypothetical protein